MLPLEGTLVLDLGQVYGGPYCGLLLRNLGARVVKIEAPSRGEPLRSGAGATDTNDPIVFQLLNGGKESVTLDLKSERGLETFMALVHEADIVIENFAPGTADSLGVGYESLRAVNPRIIYASLKAYSADTPNRDERGMDLTVQASSASMSVNGEPDGPPMRCGPSLADFLGGSHLAAGVLAAVIERDRSGEGQEINVSLQDAVIPALASNISMRLTDPEHAPERTGNRHGGMRESPYNTYPTLDGWVAILCITAPQWRGLCDLIGRPDLRDDPSLATSPGRVARMLELDDAVAEWTRTQTRTQATTELQDAGVPAAGLKTVAELIEEELGREVPMIQYNEPTDRPATYTFGSPIRLGRHPSRGAGAVPRLGEHTEAVLAELLQVQQAGVGTVEPERGSDHGS
jgi:crotonobetainyl-CoA:carnitine CoA-transferase CaiB-like acyl-CoA transferase